MSITGSGSRRSQNEGHDKQACFNYIRKTTAPYATRTYGTVATCEVTEFTPDRTAPEFAKLLNL
ncbi:MAG: hypothetical protein PHH91_11880 [Desulfuromonadaceae bacterium]|nr:hypothetical protein [Desulfuromonadaceae bacterium]